MKSDNGPFTKNPNELDPVALAVLKLMEVANKPKVDEGKLPSSEDDPAPKVLAKQTKGPAKKEAKKLKKQASDAGDSYMKGVKNNTANTSG